MGLWGWVGASWLRTPDQDIVLGLLSVSFQYECVARERTLLLIPAPQPGDEPFCRGTNPSAGEQPFLVGGGGAGVGWGGLITVIQVRWLIPFFKRGMAG